MSRVPTLPTTLYLAMKFASPPVVDLAITARAENVRSPQLPCELADEANDGRSWSIVYMHAQIRSCEARFSLSRVCPERAYLTRIRVAPLRRRRT